MLASICRGNTFQFYREALMTKHASQKDKRGQRGLDETVVDSFSASDRPHLPGSPASVGITNAWRNQI
jgi:hypothetical protein